MRRLFCVMALLLAALWARADQPPPKANALTAKAITDGWLLLFDGETTFGWDVRGDAKVADGVLTIGGAKETTILTSSEFGEFAVEFEARVAGKSRPADYPAFLLHNSEVEKQVGKEYMVYPVGLDLQNANEWTHGRYETRLKDGRRSDQGSFGTKVEMWFRPVDRYRVAFKAPAGVQIAIRNLRLQPLNMNSLFNGKDLSGWKVFKGDPKREKSTFTVTKDGWLNIKDGPGDLQTVGEWSDFVLQFDCISNGKHLNSGVFFRCRPGEYQQGYEAQVRNEFTAEPKQKYVIEEYNPKTGELKGKKDAMSTAVDYGTGAIYRRMPARKAMSKDGEWFTMTVLAHGRHLATWVNGVQVADWTDNRPLKDNARSGCRLEKGPISLQGHDPTTDLSFRNFRIAELPAKK